jgi:PiT family inorganic phosphate transporter
MNFIGVLRSSGTVAFTIITLLPVELILKVSKGAQGASAELVAMCTILAADTYGLPVSTTHVLSSGVAGTMANKSGLQMSTLRDIALAWVFTLPVAALLSGCLFWLFNSIGK